jgi:hypothetical protein
MGAVDFTPLDSVDARNQGIDSRRCGKRGSPCQTGRLLPLESRIATLIAALIKSSTTPLTPLDAPNIAAIAANCRPAVSYFVANQSVLYTTSESLLLS